MMSFREYHRRNPADREALEERAAILEFLAGYSRDKAEEMAVQLVVSSKIIQEETKWQFNAT